MGLATHPQVIRAAKKALNRYGTGACGSPVLSGLADLHRDLEQKLVAFTGRENVMLFNSGFGGALGTVAGLLRKGDAAIMDAKCHLSLIDGAKLSGARLHFFDHNDANSLDQVLEKTKGKRRLMICEGIYSMDGDMANLPELVPVAQQHNCSIFIDEAHSILACGANGRGIVEHFGFEKEVGLQFGTFSKSFASVGGFIAGRYDTIDYLRFYSNPYGFSCALPPSVVAGLLKALELTTETDELRNILWDNTKYFREGLLDMGVNIGESTSQVVPIVIGSNRNLLYQLCHEMNDRGLFLAPVDFPSVPEDGLRYRAAVTAAHTKEDLAKALQIIKDTVVKRTQ
jgi:glycine C-acetyltransferase